MPEGVCGGFGAAAGRRWAGSAVARRDAAPIELWQAHRRGVIVCVTRATWEHLDGTPRAFVGSRFGI